MNSDETVEKFTAVAEKVAREEQISQEDAEFLLAVCSTLETNLQVTHSMLIVSLRVAQDAMKQVASFVMQKCGRNDAKLKKKVSAMCEQSHGTLVEVVRIHGLTISDEIQSRKETNNDTTDNTLS